MACPAASSGLIARAPCGHPRSRRRGSRNRTDAVQRLGQVAVLRMRLSRDILRFPAVIVLLGSMGMIHLTLRIDDATNTRLTVFAALIHRTKAEAALTALMAGIPAWATVSAPLGVERPDADLQPQDGGRKGGSK